MLAVKHYEIAHEIEPELPHYQLNLAAAHLKLSKCVTFLIFQGPEPNLLKVGWKQKKHVTRRLTNIVVAKAIIAEHAPAGC